MKTLPLIDLKPTDGAAPAIERTATGWFIAAPAGLTATLRGMADGRLCRLAPSGDRDVVQLALGPVQSALCDAIYSPRADTALVFRADGLALAPSGRRGFTVRTTGPLTITVVPQYLKVQRRLPWFTPLDRRRFPRAPAGWCSWYYYYLGITEAEVVKNTDWLAEHLRPFGLEYVQIDDGWQGRGTGFGNNRDWFVTCAKDFPQGMKFCADYIHAKGLKAGIWVIPFTQSDTELYAREPALFVRKPDGTSPGEHPEQPLDYTWMPADERVYDWAGRYYLDPTGPAGEAHLRRLFTMLCHEWGYEYVKIDAQGGMASFYQQWRARMANPALDGERAYRRGLAVLREVMGPARFLLNCGHGWASIGQCEGIRIGGDVGANWAGMQCAIRSTMEYLYLNTLAFYTDPDVVCVRPPLTYDQAQTWATLLGITGQLLMTSDKMYELPTDRVELLRRLYPVADIRPLELYPLDPEKKPGIFDLKVNRPGVGAWDVVALFNWDDKEVRRVELSPARLGLPEGRYVITDGWTGRVLHAGDGHCGLYVAPMASRVLGVWPLADDRPTFVGSTRHLTLGAEDVDKVEWDAAALRLHGTTRVVGGHPTRLGVYLPPGWRVRPGGPWQQGRLVELTLAAPKSRRVRWELFVERG